MTPTSASLIILLTLVTLLANSPLPRTVDHPVEGRNPSASSDYGERRRRSPCESNVPEHLDTGETVVSQCLGADAYSASGIYGGFLPEMAFNGDHDTWNSQGWSSGYWNSGNYASQWIEVDLQRTCLVTRFRLVTSMFPDGDATHEFWVSEWPIHDDRSHARQVGLLDGPNRDYARMELILDVPVFTRFIQVRTTRSPSWVAWREVQVFARPPS